MTPSDTELGEYTLLPADDPDLSAESELKEAFIDPEGDPGIDVETAPPAPIPYGKTWQFDVAKGRFVRYGQRPVALFGKASLRQWIDFTMIIAAGAHSIFPDDYGMEDPFGMIGEPYSPALEADFQQQVQAALLPHDRIIAVDEFKFRHNDDESIIDYQFMVRTDDEDEMLITYPGFEVPSVG
jgi:Protein of unknown function (DUF2634)